MLTWFGNKKKLHICQQAWHFLELYFNANHPLSIWFGFQFTQLYNHLADRKQRQVWNVFGLAWSLYPGIISNLFKVHSWLTHNWKAVKCWQYFQSFYENAEGVWFLIGLYTPHSKYFGMYFFFYMWLKKYKYDPNLVC